MNLLRLATCIVVKEMYLGGVIGVGLVEDAAEDVYHIHIKYDRTKLVWVTPRSVSGRSIVETRAFGNAAWQVALYDYLYENNWSP